MFYLTLRICSYISNPSNEFNYLKYLALSRGYNPSTIVKALNKFKESEHYVCASAPCFNPVILVFYSFTSFKISKILLRLGSKVSFKYVTKYNALLLNILFLLRTGMVSV